MLTLTSEVKSSWELSARLLLRLTMSDANICTDLDLIIQEISLLPVPEGTSIALDQSLQNKEKNPACSDLIAKLETEMETLLHGSVSLLERIGTARQDCAKMQLYLATLLDNDLVKCGINSSELSENCPACKSQDIKNNMKTEEE